MVTFPHLSTVMKTIKAKVNVLHHPRRGSFFFQPLISVSLSLEVSSFFSLVRNIYFLFQIVWIQEEKSASFCGQFQPKVIPKSFGDTYLRFGLYSAAKPLKLLLKGLTEIGCSVEELCQEEWRKPTLSETLWGIPRGEPGAAEQFFTATSYKFQYLYEIKNSFIPKQAERTNGFC